MSRHRRFAALALLALAPAGSRAAQVPELGPEAAVAHYRAAVRADSLYDARRWADAEPLYERVVRETPRDGRATYRLGRVREERGETRQAIAAYGRAVEHGYAANAWTAYRIARLYAGLGVDDSAVAWLDRALDWRFEERPGLAADSPFAALRSDPRFRRIAAIPDAPPADRIEGWRRDIDYLVEEARRAGGARAAAAVPAPCRGPVLAGAAAGARRGLLPVQPGQGQAGRAVDRAVRRLVRRVLVRSDASVLVVDVRHNNGGNNSLVRPLIRTLVWWEMQDPGHRVFVVTGRGTFSAAQNFINRVERMTNATFVGEPSSSSPNFVGEETNLTLPWSRVRGSISTQYWQDSNPDDTRPFIWPAVPVGMTSRDYFEGRDPALEAIWRITDG